MPFSTILIIVVAVLIVAFFASAASAFKQLTRPPENPPHSFIHHGGAKPGERVAVCLGASIVHGRASVNFVEILGQRFAGQNWRFINAGVNGNIALFALKRIEGVIACRPDAVIVLVGTNDIQAFMSETVLRRFQRYENYTETPSVENYIGHMREIVTRLKKETQARVALVSLPPMGENLASQANQNVRRYNQALQQLAGEEGVAYLPVYDRMAAYLEEHGGATGPDYDGSTRNILGAAAHRYMLKQSFDEIGRQNGLMLLVDTLHLNTIAANMVADAVEGFIRQG